MYVLPAGLIIGTLACLCWNGAAQSTSNLVSVTSHHHEVPAGGEVHLLYRSADGFPISECSFKVDAQTIISNDSVSWTTSSVETPWTPAQQKGKMLFQGRYFGKGLQQGECGVTLSNVKSMSLIGTRVVQGLSINLEFASVYGYEATPMPVEIRPRMQTVAPGSDVNITCLHQGENAPIGKCSFWLASREWANFHSGHDTNSTKRYHYQGRGLKRGHCGIRLLNVTAEDSGMYMCSVFRKEIDNTIKAGLRMSVLVVTGAKPTVEVTVEKKEFAVGDILVATCRVTGPHPLPVTAWRLDNKTLPSEDSQLKESRNAWLWEEQSSTIELDTIVGSQFKELPLRCELLKDVGCEANELKDTNSKPSDFKMITVKPNCGFRIHVEFDSSRVCDPPNVLLQAAEYVDDTNDQPPDQTKVTKLKKKFEGFPWHVGIYKFISQDEHPGADGKKHKLFNHKCGGTLITRRHVLTAAHCFGDKVNKEKNKDSVFKVAMGKFFRDFGQFDCRVQWREVGMKQVHVHERYIGSQQSFQYDVAVIDLGRPVQLTTRVGLACVDWDNQYSNQLLVNGSKGWLSGWGIMSKDGGPNEELRTLALPYMDTHTCLMHLPKKARSRLTSDKFCAGFRNRSISACPGDSGGGLLFNHSTLAVYYVSGIASTAFTPSTYKAKCYTDEVTSFTAVSDFIQWLKNTIRWANTAAFQNLFYKQPPIRSDRKKPRKTPRVEPKIYD